MRKKNGHMKIRTAFSVPGFLFLSCLLHSQNPTLNPKKTTEREAPASHKIMLIPFAPKLYMGEIDRSINAETKLSAREIKYKFRDGLNEQLYKAFKAAHY